MNLDWESQATKNKKEVSSETVIKNSAQSTNSMQDREHLPKIVKTTDGVHYADDFFCFFIETFTWIIRPN